jgi:hypothetical protein
MLPGPFNSLASLTFEGKFTPRSRGFWPWIPLFDATFIAWIYFALPFIFDHPKGIDLPSCIFGLLVTLARALVVSTKYALYGDKDDFRSPGWLYTDRTNKNILANFIIYNDNKQTSASAEHLYTSGLVRDCDLSSSMLELGDVDVVRGLWTAVRASFEKLGELHLKETALLDKKAIPGKVVDLQEVNWQEVAPPPTSESGSPKTLRKRILQAKVSTHSYHNFKLSDQRFENNEHVGLLSNLMGPNWQRNEEDPTCTAVPTALVVRRA